MKCSNCGKELAPTAKFCNNCGTKVVAAEPVENKHQGKTESTGYDGGTPVQENNHTAAGQKKITGIGKGSGSDKRSILIVAGIFFVAALVGLLVKGMMNPAAGGNDDYVYEQNDDTTNDEMNMDQADADMNTEGDSEFPVNDTTDNTELLQGYLLPESNKRLLTARDLEGFTAEQCRIARNEIYARHGRIFKDEALNAYFNSCDWYRPTVQPDAFQESVLNEYETANRDFIVEYERAKGYR